MRTCRRLAAAYALRTANGEETRNMIRKNQRFFKSLNALSDGLLLFGSYLLATVLWLDAFSRNMASVRSLRSGMGVAAILYAIFMVGVLLCFQLYQTTRVRPLGLEMARILEANALGIVLAAALLYLFRLQDFSRGVLVFFYVIASATLIVKRVILRSVLNRIRASGRNQKHILVVGSGELASRYAQCLQTNQALGFHIYAHIASSADSAIGPYKGNYGQLEACLQGSEIDEVVVALGPDEVQDITQIINTCEKCGTKVSIIPFYNDIIPTKPTIEIIGSIKLINLRTTPLDQLGNAMFKRGFDIVFSLLMILLTSPIMLVAAIGTKLTSPGPILFRQERVGRNKKLFTIFKFRSMRVNDEEKTAWTTDEDPRKTKFGSFLRKTSIDELPQFFNVLKGDMSVIGPRPEIPHFVEQFRESVPLYMVKHQVRPGITGWAQVNGYRGDTSITERINHDIWYIENWTVGLDVKIILLTIFGGMLNRERVLKGEESRYEA